MVSEQMVSLQRRRTSKPSLKERRLANINRYDTQDSLYDVAWSESHENQLVVASGDGSVKLFDITLDQFPVLSWQEHRREVYAVAWNMISKDTFLSSSWDGTIKLVSILGTPPEIYLTFPSGLLNAQPRS